MHLPSWAILAIAMGLLVVAWFVDRVVTRRRTQVLRRLATESRVHYSRLDRFDLARRVRDCFPIPDVDELAVHDLMYRRGNGCYAYVFTVSFRTRDDPQRRHVVAATDEPADRSVMVFSHIALADQMLPLIKQYQSLLSRDC